MHPGTTLKKATDGTRTCDLSFTKALLYQLSYGGVGRKIVAGFSPFGQVVAKVCWRLSR